MKELNECTAEVFRRSEKRINERKRNFIRILALCIPFCMIVTVWSVLIRPAMIPAGDANGGAAEEKTSMGSLDGFTFSLTWGCYGISSYDSQTGKLVKTTDATNPEDYVTTYQLTPEQKQTIYDLILNLNVTAYPDKYNPQNDMYSAPPMTLILSVNTETVQKTIKAVDIALTYESNNREGQKFLSVCKAIQDMLTSTEEWKSLPEYEFFYD